MRLDIFQFSHVLVAFTAGAMIYGGVVLVLRAYWMRKEALAKHVALISAPDAARPFSAEAVKARRVASDPFQSEVIRRFASFGVPDRLIRRLAHWVSPATAVTAGSLALLFGPYLPFLHHSKIALALASLLSGVLGWFLPMALGHHLRHQRVKKIIEGLPEALELLVICVEAGLSLEGGISKVVTELGGSQPALAEELAITLADLELSPSREEALMGLAHRVDAPAIRTVVSTLSQTMKYGTPLSQTIRFLATELRNNSLLRIEERANKLPVLMTMPMVLFILPTFFFILLGPAALQMIDSFLR